MSSLLPPSANCFMSSIPGFWGRSCAQPRFPVLHVFSIEAATLPGVASALCSSTRLRGKGAFS